MSKDLTGTVLGKYQIIERLGRGGMADVYRAFQPIMERYVAVKVMHTHLSEDENFITRFKREAQIVGSLRHPHIVQVLDFDIHEGDYYMVMEYVQGDTLKAMLKRRGALQIGEALDITSKLADALDYAHSKGMIHRDIKPANVLMDTKGSPILSDFGIAHLSDLSGLTSTGQAVGTPNYMSPEAGRGEKVDERTDIYSLGIVLYEMLTGSVPYDADTPYAVILKHINDPLPMPRQFGATVPAFVEKIMLKALAKSREDRYQSAAEFRNAIDKAIEQLQLDPALGATMTDAAITEMGTQPAQHTSPSPAIAPRNSSWVVPAIIVAVLVLGGGAFLLTRPPAREVVLVPTQPNAAVVPTTAPTVATAASAIATEASTTAPTATVAPSATTQAPTEAVTSVAPTEPTKVAMVGNSTSASGKYAALYTEVRKLIVRGDNSAAMEKVEAALKTDPESYDLIVLRGQVNLESGQENAAKALEDAEAAVKLDSVRPEAYVLLGAYAQFGVSYDKSEDIVAANKKAVGYYTEAEQKGSVDYYTFWLRARANNTINDYIGTDNNVADIKADLEKAMSLNPEDYRFFVFRGDYYMGTNNNELAIQSYDRALALGADTYVHIPIAEVYMRMGQPENGLKYYKDQIVEKHETDPDYIAQGAYVAWRSNQFDLASEWIDLVLALNPKAVKATYVKGLIALSNKKYDEALNLFDQVATFTTDDYGYPFLNRGFGHHIQVERAHTLAALGKLEEAIEALSTVIADNYDWVEIIVERAKLYRQLGKIDEARADLRSAFELVSSDADSKRRVEILDLLKELNAATQSATP
jgi:tetratricopeptide (TPR) repeat protein